MLGKILNFVAISVAVFLVGLAVIMVGRAASKGDPLAIGFTLLYVVAFGTLAGFIFAFTLGDTFARKMTGAIFWASPMNAPPPEFSLIRAKIAKGEYEQAEKELRELLAKDNGNPHVVVLLAELFIDKTHDLRKAEGLLKAHLLKEERNSDDLKFAMMLADVYIENDQSQKALEFLKGELVKNYDKASLKSLKSRISSLDTE